MPILSLPSLFDGFILSREASGVRDTTLAMYRTAYRSMLANLPPEVISDARNITHEHILAWAAGQRELASATRDQRFSKIKSFFNWANHEGFLEDNPAIALKRPRRDWQPDPFNRDELVRLLEVAHRGRHGIRNYAILASCYSPLDTLAAR